MTRETLTAVDLGALPDLVGYHLRMAQLTVFKDFDREFAGTDITPTIFGALEILYHNKGLTPTRLANAIGLDRSSLVPLLDKLQKRNLVAHEASVKDRRSKHLFLTAEGRKLLAIANKRANLHEQRMFASLSKTEIKQLIKLLLKIAATDTDTDTE